MNSTEAKIIATFVASLTATGTPEAALIATEDAVVADMARLGSTTPEHGVRFIVRRTVTAALAAL